MLGGHQALIKAFKRAQQHAVLFSGVICGRTQGNPSKEPCTATVEVPQQRLEDRAKLSLEAAALVDQGVALCQGHARHSACDSAVHVGGPLTAAPVAHHPKGMHVGAAR